MMSLWSFIALVGRWSLAVLFLVAAVGKFKDLTAARRAATDLGVPATLAPAVAVGLPVLETVVALGLVMPGTARWAAVAALVLVSAFSVAVAVQLARGRHPDCNCFGSATRSPIGASTLVRNGLIAVAAVFLVVRGSMTGDACAIGCTGGLSRSQIVGLVIGSMAAMVVAVHTWLLLNLVRQRGELLVRVDTLERRAELATTAEPAEQMAAAARRHRRGAGPPLGAPAPRFRATDPAGDIVTIDDVVPGETPAVFVFLEPGCAACVELATEVGERAMLGTAPSDRRLIAIVHGAVGDILLRIDPRGFERVLVDSGGALSERYGVGGSPSALVVLPDGRVASALAEGRMAVSRLVRGPSHATRSTDGLAEFYDPTRRPLGDEQQMSTR